MWYIIIALLWYSIGLALGKKGIIDIGIYDSDFNINILIFIFGGVFWILFMPCIIVYIVSIKVIDSYLSQKVDK